MLLLACFTRGPDKLGYLQQRECKSPRDCNWKEACHVHYPYDTIYVTRATFLKILDVSTSKVIAWEPIDS